MIDSVADCCRLQNDLDRLCQWCTANALELNVNKCKTMSFLRIVEKFDFVYKLDQSPLTVVESVSDLGVVLDGKMDFRCHYDFVVNKAQKMLGFICRSVRDFHDLSVIKCLYYALVRSILEYASPVWSPSYESHIYSLEKVQNRFLRFLAYRSGLSIVDTPLSDIRSLFSIEKLRTRRCNADILFIHGVLGSRVDCPYIMSRLHINTPVYDTRRPAALKQEFHRCNYGIHSPLSRIIHEVNEADVDIFNLPLTSLKRKLQGQSL